MLAPVDEAKGVFGETTPQRVRDVMAHRAGAGNLPDFVEKGKRLSSATVDAMVRLDARQSREAVENARVVRALLKQEGYTVKPLIEMGIGLSDLDVSIDPVQEESQATTDDRLATAQQAAMQRLLTGESSMEQEQGRAKRASADGTLIDLVLADNPSAQELMKEDVLATMAKELAEILRRDATIDWQFKENVRAKLRLKIKTLLKKYKYPPDQQVTAIDLVLQQAETLGEDLVEAA